MDLTNKELEKLYVLGVLDALELYVLTKQNDESQMTNCKTNWNHQQKFTDEELEKLYMFNVIDAVDLYLLTKLNKESRECKTSNHDNPSFNLNDYTDEECNRLFRFSKSELKLLKKYLGIPKIMRTTNGITFSSEEGLCILLRRMAYQSRLIDLEKTFRRNYTAICRIFNHVLNLIHRDHCHLIQNLQQSFLSQENLKQFADAITTKGLPLHKIWGFIDGTVPAKCSRNQKQRPYVGFYKRQNRVQYRAIMCPNGIIARLDGPYVGKRDNSAILHSNSLLQDLEEWMVLPDGSNFKLIGDPGHINTKFVFSPLRLIRCGSKYAKFHEAISTIRSSVEWGYGKVSLLFEFCDFKDNPNLTMQPMSKMYAVATVLTNCHTCLRGGDVASFFECQPPTLAEYLQYEQNSTSH